MAWKFLFEDNVTATTNLAPSSWPAAIWNIVRALKARSWVVTADSDGTTYSATGGQVTGGGSGAHGLDNSKAWITIRDPGSKVWLTFQRDTTAGGGIAYQWRVKASISAPTSGTPGATQVGSVATAADEVILIGGGTDAAPTFATLFDSTANGTMKQSIGVSDAAPTSFYCVCWVAGRARNVMTTIFVDFLTSPSASDPAAYVVKVTSAATGDHLVYSTANSYSSSGNAYKSMKNGAARAWSLVAPGGVATGTGVAAPNNMGVNPEDGNDVAYYARWNRNSSQAAPVGPCGDSSVLRWNSISRAFGDTGTESTARDSITINDARLVWDGSVVSV